MTSGIVRNREAVLEIDLLDEQDGVHRLSAVVDTGFNGHLTLPGEVAEALSLVGCGYERGMLADGSVVRMKLFLARVDWRGEIFEVPASQTEGAPLVGMALLEGSRLTVDAIEGGAVRIEPLTAAL